MRLWRRGGIMLKYCSIGSGSSGNCHYVGYKDTNILVDAGLSGKRITTGLNDIEVDIDKVKLIFITHFNKLSPIYIFIHILTIVFF